MRGSRSHVGHVDQEIDHHHDEGDQHHQVLHDRIVAPQDRLDEEAGHAGNVEHRLGDDQAADEEGRLDADDGDDGQAARCAAHVRSSP